MIGPEEAPEHPGEGWEVTWAAPDPAVAPEAAQALYGAALSPSLFHPLPVVTVNGQTIATGPAGPGDSLIVVDGVRITWGRSEVMDQPTPATGLLRLFDVTKTWATDQDRRGQLVTLAYSGTDYRTQPLPAGALPATAIYFRGRVGSPVRVSPKTVVHPVTGATVHGSLVELPLRSVLVDLANTVPTASWPAETMGARFDRIILTSETYGVTRQGSQMRSYWRDPMVAAVNGPDQPSLLDSLEAVYNSCGADRYRYYPNENVVMYLPRRDYPSASMRGLAGLWWDGTDPTKPRQGQGVYIRTYAIQAAGATSPSGEQYVDAASLEYDPADGIATPDRITRVSISHPDSGAATPYSLVTSEVRVTDAATGQPVDETVAGIRSARVDSLVAWNSYADQAAGDIATMASKEGSAWLLQALRLDTRRTGGFESVEQAALLLGGLESTTILFLQRSWLPQYGIRPVFGVMGATIAFQDGGWVLDVQLAPVTTAQRQHAISWSEIDDGSSTYEVQWWDDDHPHGMHESLTYEDLRYCATGLNVTTIPPDQGWDETQS